LPSVYTATADKSWANNFDNLWHPVPYLSITFTMAQAGPVIITWNLAVPMNGGLVTRLDIDGTYIPSTTMVIGNTTYVTSAGTHFTTLAAGTRTVTLTYRTDKPFTYDPTADWQAGRIQVASYDK
jgi:hypothetical protein